MRVQRTRSSPSALRSPLTRGPLGNVREVAMRVMAYLCVAACYACSAAGRSAGEVSRWSGRELNRPPRMRARPFGFTQDGFPRRLALLALIAGLVCPAAMAGESRTITDIVANGDVKLAATLDLPNGRGPHPVVVVLHASGAGERGFAAYRHLAEVLPSHGIGVARYDRRGSGASTGDFERASFSDLASDARAVLRWVRGFDSVDPGRIGLWAMSQGGWIAPLVAAEDPKIAAMVIVSGAGTTPAEQMIFTARTALREAGYSAEIIEEAVRLRRAVDDYYAGTRKREDVARILASARAEPWYALTSLPTELPRDITSSKWYYQFAFDPAEGIAKTKAPVLLLFAERDPWISMDQSMAAWKTCASGKLTVRKIAGTNHFMAETTDPGRDSSPEPVSAEYSRVMIEWLVRTLGTATPTDPRPARRC